MIDLGSATNAKELQGNCSKILENLRRSGVATFIHTQHGNKLQIRMMHTKVGIIVYQRKRRHGGGGERERARRPRHSESGLGCLCNQTRPVEFDYVKRCGHGIIYGYHTDTCAESRLIKLPFIFYLYSKANLFFILSQFSLCRYCLKNH